MLIDTAGTHIGWPAQQLELLGRCPICGSRERSLRFQGLTDKVFRAAPGAWDLYVCGACRAHYLDPRPTQATIGRAYAGYYTHAQNETSACFWQDGSWKSRLKTDYLNREYGYAFAALPLGWAAVRLRPSLRAAIDYHIRHLPAPRGHRAALLDVGCGNGEFLGVATALGFAATGIDFDADAVAAGRGAGFDVRTASMDDLDPGEGRFQHITLSHTLEHLHWPLAALGKCLELLEPGGRVWISLPNMNAPGLERFGRDWRGLEPPRHLTLYGFDSLARLLAAAGFGDIRLMRSDEPAVFYYRQSEAIAQGDDPYGREQASAEVAQAAQAANRRARHDPLCGESITVTARRPG
jgi:SAM-dependent methyltransferase